MKRKTKRIISNVSMVLLNIFLLISLLYALLSKNELGYKIYWTIIPVLVLIILLTISRWSGPLLNANDGKEEKSIQKSFDNNTTISTVFFGTIYLIIQGLDCFKENSINNPVLVICFSIIIVVYELFTYLSIYNAKKETAKLLEEKYNNKK